ncbi:MAG: serine/threonine protein kinase, partial [Myxococcales bacterium]
MVTCARCGGWLEGTTGVCRHCGLPAPTRADGPALVHQHTTPAPVGGGTTGLLGSLVTPVSGAGGPAASGAALWPGQLVDGKYRVERLLGQGGMGAVYLAFETTVETHVVLKALLPHLVHQPSVRERMIREARALARIDHPNVVRLNAVVAAGSELVLVMEYVEGHDLAAHLERWRQQGRPPIESCLALFGAVVDGVEAAHREGIVHRDIKPSNVLVRDRDGRVKVTDFGIAKSAADDLQLTSGMIGTLYYMAPEQLRADPSLDAHAQRRERELDVLAGHLVA